VRKTHDLPVITRLPGVSSLDRGVFDTLKIHSPLATLSELRRKDGLGGRSVYLAAGRGHEMVGLAPVYILDREAATAVLPGNLLLPSGDGPICLIGSRHGFGNSLTFHVDLDGNDATDIIDLLLREAVDIAGAAGCDCIVLLHLEPTQRVLLPEWTGRWSSTSVETAVINVRWKSFDDYVMSLPSRRRSHVRSERRQFLAEGYAVTRRPLVEVVDVVAPLLAAVQRRYNKSESLADVTAYLNATSASMGKEGIALLISKDSRVVGFTSIWAKADSWYLRAWGCDDTGLADGGYFNGYLYEPLIRAIAAGVPAMYLSSGSMEAKLRRGADLHFITTLLGRLP
jgi:hypothetical protein